VALVAEMLGVPVEPVIVTTLGDRLADVPLRSIGGQGAFADDVRSALARGAADIAVHSAKDLPPRADPRFELVYPARADARDVLVGATLAEIPHGATVATGAPRRRAQLAALRPDLDFAELRGNIDTRLAKAHQFAAIIVAAAALHRLGIVPDRPFEPLPVDTFVPQVGQGVLAIEVRHDDRPTRVLVDSVDDAATRAAITAERAFLAVLGGDCDLPAGAHAVLDATGTVHLVAVLGHERHGLLRAATSSTDPLVAGTLAADVLRRGVGIATAAGACA
jgi:hydroxymethylbilane synthase